MKTHDAKSRSGARGAALALANLSGRVLGLEGSS
jgi:hypothetical protein